MLRFDSIFKNPKPVIGMIHTEALPGTPKYKGSVTGIIDKAVREASVYSNAGVDSIMIENMHDVPYLNRSVGHEISTLLSIVGYEVKNKTGLPVGLQILAGANKEALAAANSAGLDFIRAEGFVFAHIADEGFMDAGAGELLRYRKFIGAEHIAIFTDVKKKHSSHSITSDVDIAETAKAAEFFLSDGIILTGKSTSEETALDEVKSVKETVSLPVIIGSGVTFDNIEKYFDYADGFITGSHFKENGFWQNGVDELRVKKFMEKMFRLRAENL